jgi:hypothetical protein
MEHVRALQGAVTSGPPKYVALKGDTDTSQDIALIFGPTPDTAYTGALTYWKSFDLTDDGDVTTVLQQAPACYLYGSLIHAEAYVGNDPRIPTWEDLYLEAVATVNAGEWKSWKSDQGTGPAA